MKLTMILAAMLLGTAAAGAANATVISKEYLFTVVANGPVNHHEGRFAYTWDTDLNIFNLNSFDYMLGDTHFTLDNVGVISSLSNFVIGGMASGPGSIPHGKDDFFFGIRSDGSTYNFLYSVEGFRGVGAGSMTLTEIVAPVTVHEPAALGLLGAGVVGLGLSARRRRRIAA